MLTAPMAEEIRRLRDERHGIHQIADEVGVSERTVYAVLAGKVRGRRITALERSQADERDGWAAACMDPDEWTEWRAKNPVTGIPESDAIARPCEECPLGFAADMRAQGRCNGTPGGVADDPDAPQEEETSMEAAHPEPGISVPVALEPPCPTCQKADVCGLRPTVEGLTKLPVLVPVLDRRLSVQLAGSVTCSAYLRLPVVRSKPGPDGMTERQRRIVEAVQRHGGDRLAAAKELGLDSANVRATLRALRDTGRLPEGIQA